MDLKCLQSVSERDIDFLVVEELEASGTGSSGTGSIHYN